MEIMLGTLRPYQWVQKVHELVMGILESLDPDLGFWTQKYRDLNPNFSPKHTGPERKWQKYIHVYWSPVQSKTQSPSLVVPECPRHVTYM